MARSEPAPKAAAQDASLEFWSSPMGADIFLDGAYVGKTPYSLTVPPGEHTITMRKKDFGTWQRKMQIACGQTQGRRVSGTKGDYCWLRHTVAIKVKSALSPQSSFGLQGSVQSALPWRSCVHECIRPCGTDTFLSSVVTLQKVLSE